MNLLPTEVMQALVALQQACAAQAMDLTAVELKNFQHSETLLFTTIGEVKVRNADVPR